MKGSDTRHLLQLAHEVVTWTTQGTINDGAAGAKHLAAARRRYLKARIGILAAGGQALTVADFGGCTCGHCTEPDTENCLYHYAAQLQPDNHSIPWNCPTFYDGCNCGEPAEEEE